MRRGYADTPSGQVHYITEGAGDALVLLHQAPLSARTYLGLIPELSPRFRVIAVDTPGCGSSDPPGAGAEIGDLSGAVVHVLDALGIERAHVFGLHTGASIGAEVAAAWPSRVDRLVLMGFPLIEEPAERGALLDGLKAHSESLATVAADGSHLPKIWGEATMAVLKHWWFTETMPTQAVPEHLLRFMAQYAVDTQLARESIWPIYRAVFTYDAVERLPLIQAPTMHIEAGSPFEADFCRRSERLQDLIPSLETMTLGRGDANAAEFAASDLAGAINGFL